MRVHIGGDHAAYDLKTALVTHLEALGHEVVDHGPSSYVPGDHYPAYVVPCAEAVAADPDSLGIVLGGSGNGEQIAANKVRGIRAALAHSEETARLSREHNDAQVVSIGARMTSVEAAKRYVEVFLDTPFSHDPRHQERIDMLRRYEETGSLT